jgi:hypothetical protein
LCGVEPSTTIQRFDRKTKTYIDVFCPQIINQYNKHMGGVDLMDSHIGRHRIKMKSRKWYFRLFYHMLDLTVINSWILFKKVTHKKISQKDFRKELAQTLCQLGKNISPKRGRPSSSSTELAYPKKIKKSCVPKPPLPVRKDGIEHWPEYIQVRQRCKNYNCKSLTNVICIKCKMNLCFTTNRNCFKEYHVN